MITAKCNRCLGSATGETFDEASNNINHAVGLSRGVKCGRNYKQIVQVGTSPKTSAAKQQGEEIATTTVKPKSSKSKSISKE